MNPDTTSTAEFITMAATWGAGLLFLAWLTIANLKADLEDDDNS